jgi:hypothetical protein
VGHFFTVEWVNFYAVCPIYDGQHTSEPHTVPKAGPDVGAIVVPAWKVADERRLQHDLRIDIALRVVESGNQNGGR